MLKIMLFILALAVVFAVITAMSKQAKKGKKLTALSDLNNLTKRAPLTPHEQKMYFELTAAVPGCIVLAQVSFQALITTNSQATRNRFNRKVADFVICNKALSVIAIIELDDNSHKGKEQDDAERDALLKNAGYTTLRYNKIPTREAIQADLGTLIRAA
jgi:hypothetical protein